MRSALAPSALRDFVRLLRPLPWVIVLAWALASGLDTRPEPSGDGSDDLVTEAAARGLHIDREAIHWLDTSPSAVRTRWRRQAALLLAAEPNARADVWIAEARLSPEGRLIELTNLYNVTRTSAANETRLTVHGTHAAWTISGASHTYRVEMADLTGEPEETKRRWSRLARGQHAITNLQRLGRARGVARRSFRLDPAAEHVTLSLDDRELVVDADGREIRIATGGAGEVKGQRFVVEDEHHLAAPGNLVTWSVDRLRQASWFGDERMQLLKAVVYRLWDRADLALGSVRSDESARNIADELGRLATAKHAKTSDPTTGWPPAPMRPVLRKPHEGEGKWIPLDDDPFVRTLPGMPAAMMKTFIRTDRDRTESRIFVVLFDPRQIELHLVAGTEEPQTATGETGSGRIPRDPAVMSRLVAAFNGGFQSTHGDFGMMVDREVLVPPRPYAATVATLPDGSIGFGTWPHDTTIGPELVSFRQNLTPLIADGELNPYGRRWWGGVPADWEDDTRTVRSGMCRTREGFVAYFYGSKVDHEHLGMAMQSARCDYGLHLDMNQGHTGLEFYQVAPTDELPPLQRRLSGMWQAEGTVDGMDGWRYRGRRLIKHMQLMHFPRYIRRGQRDFFYLLLRELLPSAPLRMSSAPRGEEGIWKLDGLPQHGWPPAMALTSFRPDASRPETKVRVVELDPNMLRPADPGTAGASIVIALDPPAATDDGGIALWLDSGRASIAVGAPSPAARAIARGVESPPAGVTSAFGVTRRGMLVYAEVATAHAPDRDGALLGSVLDAAACAAKLYVLERPAVAIAGVRDLAGHPVTPGPDALWLARIRAPGSRRIFPETPILPFRDWKPLQQQTRFFKGETKLYAPPQPAR